MEKYDIDNLTQVWLRVSGSGEDTESRETDAASRLRRFINCEAAHGAMYTLLAIKTKGGPAEHVFRRAAEDERRHEKLLQTEYFLLKGDTCVPESIQPSAPYPLEAIRRQYIEETRCAQAYEAEAAKASDPRSKTLFSQLARDERRHAAAMRALVERLMG